MLKSVLIFGASRGIGACMATTLAKCGYLVGIVGKTITPPSTTGVDHLKGGTIYEVADAISTFGGQAVAIQCDVRNDKQIELAVQQFVEWVKKKKILNNPDHLENQAPLIDAVIYNTGAIFHGKFLDTPLKRFDLLHQVNSRGFYEVVQRVVPYMLHPASGIIAGRIICISPPVYQRFLREKVAYGLTKVAMTLLVQTLVHEPLFSGNSGGGVVCLWPAKGVAAASTESIIKEGRGGLLRTPNIMADAVVKILQDDQMDKLNGKALLDEDYLRDRWGYKDFSSYQFIPGVEPPRMMPNKFPSLTIDPSEEDYAAFGHNSKL